MERVKDKQIDKRQMIVWAATILMSMVIVFVGNKVATQNLNLFSESSVIEATGVVTEISDRETENVENGGDDPYEFTRIDFKCKITSGEQKGEVVEARQTNDNAYAGYAYTKEVEKGDKVTIFYSEDEAYEGKWQFTDYARFESIMMLFAVFVALILFIGRWKGFNTLISLLFTFAFVFGVFVPAVLSGQNPYLWSAITCEFIIIMALVLINNASMKTLATIIGCIAGTVIAAAGTYAVSKILHITGFVDGNSYYLASLNENNPIDLSGLVFAAIIIGSLGAVMDIAMDLASALYEISEQVPDITFKQMYKSGMNIGRDIMGTMANTLVLAYIGSSLCSIMLLIVYAESMTGLLNREAIIVEFMQAIIGSLAILLTIPCTVCVCGSLYLSERKQEELPAK